MSSLLRVPSILRAAEHRALSDITLSGSVLDLGGNKDSEYQSLFCGKYAITTLNLYPDTMPDVLHDLETPLPFASASYDGVLLINVLEHIFNYRALLAESVRVLGPGGTLVIIVPFLFPIHPSPRDYHRFSEDTLKKECSALGLEEIAVLPLGTGVFSARYLMLDRLLPSPVRFFRYYTFRYLAGLLDSVLAFLSRMLGKKYDAADYALGYCVTARKSRET